MARNKESSYDLNEPRKGRFQMDDALANEAGDSPADVPPAKNSRPKFAPEAGRAAASSASQTPKSSGRPAPATTAAPLTPKKKQKSRGVTKSVYFKEPVLQYLESFGDDYVFSDLVNQIISTYAAEHPNT